MKIATKTQRHKVTQKFFLSKSLVPSCLGGNNIHYSQGQLAIGLISGGLIEERKLRYKKNYPEIELRFAAAHNGNGGILEYRNDGMASL